MAQCIINAQATSRSFRRSFLLAWAWRCCLVHAYVQVRNQMSTRQHLQLRQSRARVLTKHALGPVPPSAWRCCNATTCTRKIETCGRGRGKHHEKQRVRSAVVLLASVHDPCQNALVCKPMYTTAMILRPAGSYALIPLYTAVDAKL